MTPASIEIRAAIYAVVIGLIFALGFRVGSKHIEAEWNVDKLAQAAALSKAQTDLTTALAERVQLQQTVASQNAIIQKNSDTLVSNVNDSLRSVQAALRASALFSSMANSSAGAGTGAKPGSNSELEQSFSAVGAAISQASTACLHDARELSDIQIAAPKSPTP